MTTSSAFVESRYRRFAIYTNQHRAVPSITDGLKHSQRIALWVMKNEGISTIKTAGMAGRMISSLLYVHGDAAAGDTLGRMASPFLNNIPLLKGTGNFGTKVNPDGIGAPRYTDIARPSYLDDLMYVDLPILPMEDNYDGSVQMPSTFYPILPMVLVNGSIGLGVGYNCTIFPRDPRELADAVISILMHPDRKIKQLAPAYLPLSKKAASFVEYDKEGKMVWSFSGSAEVVDTSTIRITNLPPVSTLNLEKFRELLMEYEQAEQIKSWVDNSSSDYSIVVKFTRGAVAGWSEDDALAFFKLTRQSTENINVVDFSGNAIKMYLYDKSHKYPDPVERLLREWVEWRFAQYTDRFKYLLKQAELELIYERVLLACFDDQLPKRILAMNGRQDVLDAILAVAISLGVTDQQLKEAPTILTRIAERASYRWTKEAHEAVRKSIADIKTQITEYKRVIADPQLQMGFFKDEVKLAVSKLKL